MSNRSGFTLSELLTVIMIIGLATAFGLASFSTSRARSRDNRRIADLKLIQTSLELYRSDIDKAGQLSDYAYPLRYFDTSTNSLNGNGLYANPQFTAYLTTTPLDPIRSKPYLYFGPGCLRPGHGTQAQPAVMTPAKDRGFHTVAELQDPANTGRFCPSGSGWLPYLLSGRLELPSQGSSRQSGLVNLAESSDRAIIYSVAAPIFGRNAAGQLESNDPSVAFSVLQGQSVCYPAISGCGDD